MKKRLLPLFMLLLAVCLTAKAKPVDVKTARQVGAKFLNANTTAKVASEKDLEWVTTYRTDNGTAAFYVFNAKEGWIIVAADDCVTPILAYSTDGQFDESNLPPAMEEYLMSFVEQIGIGIESHLPALDTVAHQWELVQTSGLLRDDRAVTLAVSPLLSTTWGQGAYDYKYNIFCPTDSDGPNGHAITGCVATSMGQIMRYWRYPHSGVGSNSYTPPRYPDQPQYVNFGNAIYNYNNMPDALSPSSTNTENNAVAKLLWHCGVSVDMNYGPTSSGSHNSIADDALRDHFKFSSNLHYETRANINNDAQWLNMLKQELNEGRPAIYGSTTHSFICDGYDSNDYLHFNWGWYGNSNDYYALGALNPGSQHNTDNDAILGICPLCEDDTYVHALPYHEDFEVEETEFFCFTKFDWLNYSHLFKSKWTTHASNGSVNPPSGNLCAMRPYNSTSSGDCNDWLVMNPVFLQPGRDASTLTFKTYEGFSSDYTFEGVYVSNTGTSTSDFTQVWTQNNPSASWKTVSINLNAYRGQIIYIAFVYTGANGHNWYIDDVNIEQSWSPCGGNASLPFNATFDTSLDYCWYNIDGDMSGENKCWKWYSDGDLQCVIHPKGQEGVPQVGWLITRRVFLQPGRDETKLSFKAGTTNADTGSGKKNSVWIAVDKTNNELVPSDFTKIWEDPAYNSNWTTYNVDLSSYQGHFVNIAFKYEGTYSHNWFIDNVNITESWSSCGTASAPYSETFDSSISDCWYIIDSDKSGGAKCWKWSSDNQCAYHPFGQEGISQVGWLFSKKVSLPSNHAYKLTFKSKCQYSGTDRRSSVWIAVDKSASTPPNPSDFTEIWVDPSYSSSWKTYEIDLSSYSGHGIHIAFKYEGTYAHSWYIDDFSISQIPTYTISASASPSAGGSVTGGGTYNEGTTCTLTATANTGYHFVNWTKNGTQVSTEPAYSFTVTGNGTYVANFALDSYTITASASPTAGGTVTGAGDYDHGSTCTLTATPNNGYIFNNWKKNGTVVSTNMSYSFTVTSDGAYVAQFQAVPTGSQLTVYPDATTIDSHIPMYVYYFDDFTRAQHIIPASELTEMNGGQITAVKYYTNSDNIPYSTVSEIDFYLKEVDSPTLSGYVDKSTAQIVYHGMVHFTSAGSGGEVIIIFTTPFSYNGGNLLVGCDNTTDIGYKNIKFIGETGHTNAAIYGSDGSSLGNVSADYCSFLPKSTFTYTGGGGSTITQSTHFVNGWTWWSTYIEEDGGSCLTQLENGLGTSGQIIKNQSASLTHIGSSWYGGFTSLDNAQTYRVKTTAAVDVDITGPAVATASHPVTLKPNWTWIGYPCTSSMSVATALAGITPTAGDVLKSQTSSTVYIGTTWAGSLNTITPGMGLMYYSKKTSNMTLVYPTAKGEETKPNLTPENNHWQPNTAAYADNMTVLAVVELDGAELQSESYELAVFANDECRGSVQLLYIEPLNRHMAVLTVAGEEAAELRFRLYNTLTGEEYLNASETLTYQTNTIVGSPDAPFTVRFRSNTGLDDFSSRIQLFPNPVQRGQRVTLGLSAEETGEVQVTVINALGVVLETQSIASLQGGSLKAPNIPGVYTLRITVEGMGTCYRKLVVE